MRSSLPSKAGARASDLERFAVQRIGQARDRRGQLSLGVGRRHCFLCSLEGLNRPYDSEHHEGDDEEVNQRHDHGTGWPGINRVHLGGLKNRLEHTSHDLTDHRVLHLAESAANDPRNSEVHHIAPDVDPENRSRVNESL